MQELSYSDDEWVNELEDLLEEDEETKLPRRRLVKKSISVPELVDKDDGDLNDDMEPAADFNDKVGKKRQRKKDESGLEKTKNKKKKKQDEVQNSAEIQEMWDSITNDMNSEVC